MNILKKYACLIFILLIVPFMGYAQSNTIMVNLSFLDGVELTPTNVYNFQVINNGNKGRSATVKGSLRYRDNPLSFDYSFQTTLQVGVNQFSQNNVFSPQWSFSDNALKELFFDYGKLPQGTYEYCVTIEIDDQQSELIDPVPVSDCIYQTVNDIFLINLVDPEDDAKIYEYYPMLSWVVNYPFAAQLSYKVRVAALQEGQNNQAAITRNNPVFQDNQVFGTSIVYPVTAKPLVKDQPYVWTVDAYYKGILLGGAEVWKFTIIEDPELDALPSFMPYLDVRNEIGQGSIYAIGELKLKYELNEAKRDSLTIHIEDVKGKKVNVDEPFWIVEYGDNRKVFNFYENATLKHNKEYKLTVKNLAGKHYIIPFKYFNPTFLNKQEKQ